MLIFPRGSRGSMTSLASYPFNVSVLYPKYMPTVYHLVTNLNRVKDLILEILTVQHLSPKILCYPGGLGRRQTSLDSWHGIPHERNPFSFPPPLFLCFTSLFLETSGLFVSLNISTLCLPLYQLFPVVSTSVLLSNLAPTGFTISFFLLSYDGERR